MTFVQWLLNEYRLMKADNWSGGVYHNDEPPPFTANHHACKATLEKLARVRDRMHRQKMRLLDGRPYTRHTDLRESFAAVRGEKS